MTVEPKRITLVADEMLGQARSGGLGTATSHLALALGQLGHSVELLFAGQPSNAPLDREWERLYEGFGVRVRPVPRRAGRVEPAVFGRARDVELALRQEPPDVVIVQDLGAPAYTALRSRHLGLGFEHTLFVVYCHGTRQWITDVARKVRVLPGALTISVLEQASVELADVVVSPSAYLLEWMRSQGWELPGSPRMIPYVTRSAATGEPPATATTKAGRVARLTFFGRLEERKGLRPFAAGLNAVDGPALKDVELEFLGTATPAWPRERVLALLSERTRSVLRDVSFATDVDQRGALERLSRPGTLAVMPSLEDNSPNAVYECIERGVPFLASSAGGTAELVAAEDRDRVLFAPTADGVAGALRRALESDAFAPARFAFEPGTTLDQWADVISGRPQERPASQPGQADSVLHLHPDDEPDKRLEETLSRAQAVSGADVVTCGVTLDSGVEHYFLGDPAALGLLSNAYGTVALIRRSLLEEHSEAGPARDPEWPLLARLALSGASIVSVPEPLVRTRRHPGDVRRDPAGALAVLHAFERRLPASTHSLARLATGLAAQAAATATQPRPGPLRRLSRLLPRR